MKKLFAISIAVLFASTVFGQKLDASKVPQAVTNSFALRYSLATDAKWERVDSLYKVEFLMDDGAATLAKFDTLGTWRGTFWNLPVDYVPQSMRRFNDSTYVGFRVTELYVVDIPVDGKVYKEVVCKKNDCHNVYFSLSGVYNKAEAIAVPVEKKNIKGK